MDLAEARRAWPGVVLADDVARRWIDARGDAVSLNVPDLYIACACAGGDQHAIVSLEERYFGEVDFTLRDATLADEVKQLMRRQLFVVDGTRPPGIASFSGHGQLRRWLRVVALRCAQRLGKRAAREVELDDALPTSEDNPELAYLKRVEREAFAAALSDALAALTAEDRLLLRQHVIDELGIDALAALHRIHRATAARRLVAIRAQVAEHTRESLQRRLGIDGASLFRILGDQLDVSIRRHL